MSNLTISSILVAGYQRSSTISWNFSPVKGGDRMTAVSWMVDLDKKEHKNWIMVGCALNITQNGIAQLIQGKMVAWYQFIKSNPPLQALPPCICAHPSSKCATCRMWKKELERLHKSPRPKICWDNSDRQQWGSATGAWEIAKVFVC